MESYKKELIRRFWEERRLTHPHITLLYDLAFELYRGSILPAEIRMNFEQHFIQMETLHAGTATFHLANAEDLYLRNIHETLETDITTQYGDCTVAELSIAIKELIQKITSIVSDMAHLYYADMQIREWGEE